MRDVVVAPKDVAFAVDDEFADRGVVGAREGERLGTGRVVQQLTDHPAVREDRDAGVRVRRRDAAQRRVRARVERVVRFGTGDHVPTLLHEDLGKDRIARGRAFAQHPAFPFAEVHLTQIGFDSSLDGEPSLEWRRGLVGAHEGRHVDGIDTFGRESFGDALGLPLTLGVENGVTVAVAERERPSRDRGCGLAVPHEQDRGRAGWRRVAILAKALGNLAAHRRQRYVAVVVVDGIEFVPEPSTDAVRVYRSAHRVRLADVTPRNRLRLDAIARMLQDVSSDDTADADTIGGEVVRHGDRQPRVVWILRRLALRIGRLPGYRTDVEISTWCSGLGRCWAERRTRFRTWDGSTFLDATGLWACTDPTTGAPVAPGPEFDAVFAPAAAGRTIAARIERSAPPPRTATSDWGVRASDFDVLGHVNNASYWHPVEAVLAHDHRRIDAARIEFRGGVDPGEAVEVATVDLGYRIDQWWLVDRSVRASIAVGFEQ